MRKVYIEEAKAGDVVAEPVQDQSSRVFLPVAQPFSGSALPTRGFTWEKGQLKYEVAVHTREDETFLVLFEDTTDYAISEEILMNARGYLEHS